MKHRTPYIYICIVFLLTVIACANPGGGPDGGPYDETPPVIVETVPALGATDVRPRKISIRFNELIKVENAQDKIVISPPQREAPEIKVYGRHINVEFADSLLPSTTYTVDFSDAIVDNNEGNPLGNFTYYFSTGDRVDTMEVAGYVLSADDLEPIKGINVGLHANLSDTAFTSLPFQRVGRTDENGKFTIKGISPGVYFIYALNDMDGDFKYTRGETLAFSPDTIRPAAFTELRSDTLWADTVRIDTIRQKSVTRFTPDNIVLLAFTEKSRQRQLLKAEREPSFFRLYFTAPSEITPKVEPLNFEEKDAWVRQVNETNDTLTYWLRDSVLVNRDSLRIRLTYEASDDSTGLNITRTDTLDLIPKILKERRDKLQAAAFEKWQKRQEQKKKRGLRYEQKMPGQALEVIYETTSMIAPDENFVFRTSEPLEKMDTALFHLYLKIDSTYHEAPFRIESDSLNFLRYRLRAEWRPGQEYVVNIDSAAMTGMLDKVNITYDSKFKIKKSEEMGALFLLIPDADTCGVVQLVDAAGKLVKQGVVKNKRVDFFYINPGDYYLKYFADGNGNGRIDGGNYAEKTAAEKVRYFSDKIQVRANWDIEQTWVLDAQPLYQQKPRELIKQKAASAGKITPQMRNAEREAAKGKG